jgi:hypothetical protein
MESDGAGLGVTGSVGEQLASEAEEQGILVAGG